MSNFNHANDELKTPLCNRINNGNHFSKKKHHLKNLIRLLELAYEGFHFANNYTCGEVSEKLQIEGVSQCNLYLQIFDEALLSLEHIFHEMQSSGIKNVGGE